ncbi:Fatty acid metabolism regulator protein (plasmid) [Variovorax sp. SRS16]|uniref:TetR/AcrR family transcriptional regulator n=1 Tax=Variovorax sp. SRS16 TaxID=282217 RepID=UPI0013199C3D|nr:TetR/AcrR family transcriptional regulator [Variovorax sp. SRS16]VTU46703.1 Fatty acid metabolism regulator protein [Variovorax sp. SRS16]
MPQVKKEDIRAAILEATFSLVADKGYVGASMTQIAQRAGISNANIYIYFGSKIDIFFSVYERWLKEKIGRLEERVRLAAAPKDKFRTLLEGLFQEIPKLDNGFANNLIQAISTIGPNDPYHPQLLEWLKSRIEEMLKSAIPDLQKAAAKRRRLAHFIIMAFDGCVVNFRVNPSSLPETKLILELTDLFLQ